MPISVIYGGEFEERRKSVFKLVYQALSRAAEKDLMSVQREEKKVSALYNKEDILYNRDENIIRTTEEEGE